MRFLPLAFLLPAAALGGAAWHRGWIDLLAASDPTFMTQGIAAAAVWGLLLASWKHMRLRSGLAAMNREQVAVYIAGVKHLAVALVLAGLIGTVIGFVMALQGVDPRTAGDVSAMTGMVATLIQGMSIALYTTLAGSVGSLVLMLAYRFLLVRPAVDMLAARDGRRVHRATLL